MQRTLTIISSVLAGIQGALWFFLLIHGGWGLVLGPAALAVATAVVMGGRRRVA